MSNRTALILDDLPFLVRDEEGFAVASFRNESDRDAWWAERAAPDAGDYTRDLAEGQPVRPSLVPGH